MGHAYIATTLVEVGGEALLLITADGSRSCLYVACQEGYLKVANASIEAGGEAIQLLLHLKTIVE